MDGEDALDALLILSIKGEEAVIEHLAQWHDPGKHATKAYPSHGSDDDIYTSKNYVLNWNGRLGYIGLEHKVYQD